MNYDELQAKKREEAQQAKAATVIQERWRNYVAQQMEEREAAMALKNAREAAAAAEADLLQQADGADDDEEVIPMSPEEKQEALVEEYRRLLMERDAIIEQNVSFQRSLAQYFNEQRARYGDDGEDGAPLTSPQAEQQYWFAVRQLREEKQRANGRHGASESDLDALQMQYRNIIEDVRMQEFNFREYMAEMARNSSFLRSSKPIPEEEVKEFLETEDTQRAKIQSARIRYIQLQNQLTRIKRSAVESEQDHGSSRSRGGASDGTPSSAPTTGMYLIDFEQLKIENSNLNEKIEERNEDLMKLRRKVTTTIHVLTHVKEKLEFMRGENTQLRQQVSTTEGELNGVRDSLAQTKRRRDGLSKANQRMREQMPLVGSEDLLLDYSKRKEAINQARIQVVDLTERHKELTAYIQSQQPVIDDLKRALSHYPT